MKHFKCLNEGCEDNNIYRFKGLCRSCTEYDDNGKVLVAVNRDKVNADGSRIQEVERHTHSKPITRRERMAIDRGYSAQRKMNTKMRKVRQIMRDEGIDMDHVCDESCEHGADLSEIMEIGTSVGHVHGPDCDHDHDDLVGEEE